MNDEIDIIKIYLKYHSIAYKCIEYVNRSLLFHEFILTLAFGIYDEKEIQEELCLLLNLETWELFIVTIVIDDEEF